jgi:hypothetical protein
MSNDLGEVVLSISASPPHLREDEYDWLIFLVWKGGGAKGRRLPCLLMR